MISPGFAGTDAATAVIVPASLGGGEFDYTISLKNTGSNNLGTFWFGWIPGEDFMPVSPTNIVSPTDWTAAITHGGPSDGFAIQWVDGSSPSNPLTPGSTFTFSFESTVTPAAMAGNSPEFPGTPIGTAFVYSGVPFSDGGDRIIATVTTPEPSTYALILLGAGGLCVVLRRRSDGISTSA